jgi:hypothetical protein
MCGAVPVHLIHLHGVVYITVDTISKVITETVMKTVVIIKVKEVGDYTIQV